jgi:hypothetical protein
MRKHPVDDLFKRKLSDIEKKPSSAAWEKIQAKTKKERRLAGWVWYAAASVAVVLIAGYIVWNAERTNIETIDKKEIAVVSQPSEHVNEIEKDSVQNIEIEAGEMSGSAKELASNGDKPKREGPISINKSAKSEATDQLDARKIEPETLATINIERKEEIIPEMPSVEITPKTEEVILAKVNPVSTEPTRTIVVAVQTNDQDSEDKPKSSKFSKVFRQLKNARAGERVDWEEVGFNPKSLVAKVDDRFRNGEEKVSEKYHNLKDKTKL